MISLDMWLPPSLEVDTWGLVDGGQLGPAVRCVRALTKAVLVESYLCSRFGLLTPQFSNSQINQTWNHWKSLRLRETMNNFILPEEQLQFVIKHTVDDNGK